MARSFVRHQRYPYSLRITTVPDIEIVQDNVGRASVVAPDWPIVMHPFLVQRSLAVVFDWWQTAVMMGAISGGIQNIRIDGSGGVPMASSILWYRYGF